MVHYTDTVLICLFLCTICDADAATPTHKGKYGFTSKVQEIVIPTKVDADGEYVSHRLHHRSKRRTNDKIHYRLSISGENHHLELIPKYNIISPGFVVETHYGAAPHEKKFKRFDQTQHCHHTGSIRGLEDSKAALSTCDGLAGYIRTKRGYYLIEPAAGYDEESGAPHPHLIYMHDKTNLKGDLIPTPHRMVKRNESDEEYSNPLSAVHVETLLVLDRAILNYHKTIDVENFVLTVFNMADNLFQDASLNINIHLAIVRMIRLEVEAHEMNIASHRNALKTLNYFRSWQKQVNPTEDKHPNHHDLAILLTRIDICGDDKSCGLMGAAMLSGICDPDNQAVLCQDIGLRMGFIIAHEIGHTLGLQHDGTIDGVNDTTVMSPNISARTTGWSNCSNMMMRSFFDSGFGACLYDPPTDHSFQPADVLPGVMYDTDYQCKEIFGPNAAMCMTGVDCNNLICYIEDKGCVESYMKPAEGTNCGENKWCFRGDCVEVGERPNAEDGGWGEWSEWSDCTRTCGSGVSSQLRYCDHPYPTRGGKACSGDDKRFRICSTEPCELGEPTFRDLQCSEFNTWEFPEDGKVHQWKSYPVHDENPCALYCVNEGGNVASLRSRVIDGTTCYRGIRNICISGLCQEIPCDLDLQSDAVEDKCGICKGDGTTCDVMRGQKSFICGKDIGEKQVFEVPKGAMNFKIEEMTPSESLLQVRDKDGHSVMVSGEILGIFDVVGSKAWVGMIRTKQEAISIIGPTTKIFTIWIDILQNSTIRWSYGVKATKKRDPRFKWDFLDWSRCSAECGPGTQVSRPRCIEKQSGLVDSSHCRNLKRPRDHERPCEMSACVPMWFVSDWSKCSKCPRGTKTRIVKCFISLGMGEGEMDFISDVNCVSPKPKASVSCTCRHQRDAVVPTEGPTTTADETTVSVNIPEVKPVVDMLNYKNMKLIVHTELESAKYPVGLPHPKNINDTTYELQGKEAMKFLNTLQHDFSNNKTRI